jgi:hypothetical protein
MRAPTGVSDYTPSPFGFFSKYVRYSGLRDFGPSSSIKTRDR